MLTYPTTVMTEKIDDAKPMTRPRYSIGVASVTVMNMVGTKKPWARPASTHSARVTGSGGFSPVSTSGIAARIAVRRM
ncbi:hypothetical protein TR74_20095 [Carbonactinospora thermoautotrophica]|uniref:Uncharacterized protein n=1 Tax=Carbonactinospora thermoautotrophica TaxID=1469144 RepID=A0A132NAD9_9ACTN|nr:hypothetical protein TR74_20095 [Carbonactinospora thermoautotrophica]